MNAHPIVGDQARPASRERRARGLLGALLAGLALCFAQGLQGATPLVLPTPPAFPR